MGLIQIFFRRNRSCRFDAIRVIQQHAKIADTTDAGFRANGRLTHFNARVAEDTFFRLAAFPVVINLFIRTRRDAHAPAATLVLINQHNAVFLAFVDCTAGAGGDTGWVEAVFAKTRQIHHEGFFEGAINFTLDVVEIFVFASLGKFGAENFFPVRTPMDFLHAFAGNQRARTCRRLMIAFGGLMQVLVIEIERFVVIVDLRQVGIGENLGKDPPAAAGFELQTAAGISHPATVPLLLVFPFLGIADAGFGFDVVEPCVFDTFARGPHVLAGNRAGMATNAFVEVEHHRNLGTYFHREASAVAGTGSPSCHSTLSILRTMTNSSRLVPVVP